MIRNAYKDSVYIEKDFKERSESAHEQLENIVIMQYNNNYPQGLNKQDNAHANMYGPVTQNQYGVVSGYA
jgi:hypothetical protein